MSAQEYRPRTYPIGTPVKACEAHGGVRRRRVSPGERGVVVDADFDGARYKVRWPGGRTTTSYPWHITANDETARLTADVVLMAEHDNALHVLLIQRGKDPFKDRWAIPGGHVDADEDVDAAGHRELAEETGLASAQLDLVGVYSTPGRDPRGRYITFAYVALLEHRHDPTAGDDARAARWIPVEAMLADPDQLAFDHHQILTDATAHVRATLVGGAQ